MTQLCHNVTVLSNLLFNFNNMDDNAEGSSQRFVEEIVNDFDEKPVTGEIKKMPRLQTHPTTLDGYQQQVEEAMRSVFAKPENDKEDK